MLRENFVSRRTYKKSNGIFHNEELLDLFYCANIIRAIESKKDDMDTTYGLHGGTEKFTASVENF